MIKYCMKCGAPLTYYHEHGGRTRAVCSAKCQGWKEVDHYPDPRGLEDILKRSYILGYGSGKYSEMPLQDCWLEDKKFFDRYLNSLTKEEG